jgi:NAD(P)-dependent dehydrogenase (short-subunit alcohol dehydrogenase family)
MHLNLREIPRALTYSLLPRWGYRFFIMLHFEHFFQQVICQWRLTLLTPADHSQYPAGMVGTPEDIASMVSYLISPQAAFVTAQNFVVDAGMTRKMIY